MHRSFLLLPLLVLPLMSCTTVNSWFTKEKVLCPTGRIVSDAAQVTRFRPGGGTTPNDIALTVSLSPPKVTCDYDSDEHVAQLKAVFPITLREGAAKSQGDQEFTYFVAVVDNTTDAILTRKDYRIPLSLAGLPQAVYNEEVENLSLTVAKGKQPADYRILIGLVLTPAELAYNRATRSPIP
jgi:hypothetical protein